MDIPEFEKQKLLFLLQKWALTFNAGRWDILGNRLLKTQNNGQDLQNLCDETVQAMAYLTHDSNSL